MKLAPLAPKPKPETRRKPNGNNTIFRSAWPVDTVQSEFTPLTTASARPQAAPEHRYPQSPPVLEVSDVNDVREREADTFADLVMKAPAPTPDEVDDGTVQDGAELEEELIEAPSALAFAGGMIPPRGATSVVWRKCEKCEELESDEAQIQRAACAGQRGGPTNADFSASVHSRVRLGGSPLSAQARHFFEPRLNVDLGAVRVHTDANAGSLARQIGARAFTLEQDIFFAPGEFRPNTRVGMRLLAHEVAHTMQSAGRGGAPSEGWRDAAGLRRTDSRSSQQLLQRSPGPDVAHDDYMDPGELNIDTRKGMEAFYIQRITAYMTLHEAFWDRTFTQWEKDGEFNLKKNPELVEEIKSVAYELRDNFYTQWDAFEASEAASEEAEAKFIAQLDETWVRWNAENLREWTEAKEILMNLPGSDKGKSSYAWYLEKIKAKIDYATKYGGRFPEQAKAAIEQANKMKARLSPERAEDIAEANQNIAIANFNINQLLKTPIDEFIEVFLNMKHTERHVADARSAAASVGFDFALLYRTVKSRARHKDKFVRSVLTETLQKHVIRKFEGEEAVEPVDMSKERRLTKYKDSKRKKPNITPDTVADYFKKKFTEPMLVNKDAGELHAMLEDLASKYPELFPDYLVFLMEDFAGLTYKTAQNQWRDPVALVKAIIKNQLGRTEGLADLAKTKKLEDIIEKAKNFSAEQALAFVVKMRKRGQIPEFAWAYIVSATDLKFVAEHLAEVRGYPPEREYFLPPLSVLRFDQGRVADFKDSHPDWVSIIGTWKAKSDLNAWFAQLIANLRPARNGHRPSELTATSAVCNQTAEVTQAYRTGRRYFTHGGLRNNATQYAKDGRLEPYSGQSAQQLLRPGNSIFWMKWVSKKPTWSNSVDYHSADIKYPMYKQPRHIDIMTCQDTLEGDSSASCEPGTSEKIVYDSVPIEDDISRIDIISSDVLACRERSASKCGIVRKESRLNTDTLKEEYHKHKFLTWKHQATVVWSPYVGDRGAKILTFETDSNKGPAYVGPRVRTLAELDAKAPLIRVGVDPSPEAPQGKISMTPDELTLAAAVLGEEAVQACVGSPHYDDEEGSCVDDLNYTPTWDEPAPSGGRCSVDDRQDVCTVEDGPDFQICEIE